MNVRVRELALQIRPKLSVRDALRCRGDPPVHQESRECIRRSEAGRVRHVPVIGGEISPRD